MTIIIQLLKLTEQYWRSLTLFLFTVITIWSLTPLEELPPIPGSDKTHHILAYAALILPIAIKKPKFWRAIALFLVAWSGIIEILQPYINRYGEWRDFAANVLGLVVGWFIGYWLTKSLRYRS